MALTKFLYFFSHCEYVGGGGSIDYKCDFYVGCVPPITHRFQPKDVNVGRQIDVEGKVLVE